MKRELRLFFTALSFFTRIPCTAWAGQGAEDLNHAARYFPLVGVVMGLAAAGAYLAARLAWPQELAVIAAMAATLWLTGAFHEDGLADAADGLGGGWTQQQALTIMQDSRLGSFGAVALFMGLLTKYETLIHLAPALVPAALIAGHALSRLCAVLVISTQSYVRSHGKAKPLATKLSIGELALAAICGTLPLALLPPYLWWALVPVLLVWVWFGRLLQRRLGGYTGDCLGAMQQLCELAFYLGLLGLSA
ncbi:MAG TPA: adenosylcobinamide-GDP ribazoletransferase [Novimethylophilus sp.]|jgi:adenosylcobinamide-GDP ribazoletransferase|uniref:adenosylcobinamide-GDP ribazoletransferase n=1 Tax=Novimethylophilus sp. TaxID=2137426 RepID=UPI002F4020AD